MKNKTFTTVIFVRHAQAVQNEDDRNRPLTEAGLKDAGIVLETLRGRDIHVFASSPYQRSLQTILETSRYFDLPIFTDERFRERKVGTDEPSMLKNRWADFSFAEKDGECLQHVQDRNIAALQALLHEHAGKTIVVGTHGTALSTILHYYDPTFDVNGFLRIVDWMPYIVELVFEGDRLVSKKELAHVDKAPED
ncbi:MAG: histidine phosphatase family protein [Clostridiales bacterium]|nr:histidine phosphatase family protein [Clostridiales bacterium]